MNKEKYNVEGMSCGSCKIKIEREVNQLEGIKEAVVDIMNKELMVTFENDPIDTDDIVKAVDKAGYVAKKA